MGLSVPRSPFWGGPGFCFGKKKNPIWLERLLTPGPMGQGAWLPHGAAHRLCLTCRMAAGFRGDPELRRGTHLCPSPPQLPPWPTSSGVAGAPRWGEGAVVGGSAAPRPQTPAHLPPAGKCSGGRKGAHGLPERRPHPVTTKQPNRPENVPLFHTQISRFVKKKKKKSLGRWSRSPGGEARPGAGLRVES